MTCMNATAVGLAWGMRACPAGQQHGGLHSGRAASWLNAGSRMRAKLARLTTGPVHIWKEEGD